MIHPLHFTTLVVMPTLEALDMYSASAASLLLGTAAQESKMGLYLMQIGAKEEPQGPALGIYQMEPATHDDLWNTYINRTDKHDLLEVFVAGFDGRFKAQRMVYDLMYATAMARIHYWRVEEPLPKADDIQGLARYWKKYYNTEKGKGTEEEFISNYKKYVSDILL